MENRDERHYQNVDRFINSQIEQYPTGKNCCILVEPNFGAVGNVTYNVSQGLLSAFLTQTVKRDVISDLLQAGKDPKEKNKKKEGKDFIPLRKLAKKLKQL